MGNRLQFGSFSCICQVRDGLGHGAKRGGRLHPSHGACHGDGNELLFSLVAGHDDGQAGAVIRAQEHAVVSVLDVVLAQMHRPVGGIRVTDVAEQAVQSAPKLEGFGRSVRQRLLVHGVPRMVAQQTGLALPLLLDGRRRRLQLGEVTDQAVRQNRPETVIDEFG
jgi:hypothetical protein